MSRPSQQKALRQKRRKRAKGKPKRASYQGVEVPARVVAAREGRQREEASRVEKLRAAIAAPKVTKRAREGR